jgi:putative ABC transport system substrate-binding protein
MPVIGFLHTNQLTGPARLRGFRQCLGETGYVEGRNVTAEYRWAEDHSDRFRRWRPTSRAVRWQ